MNFVFMKRQVDRHGEGRGWLSAGFGFSNEAWEKSEKQVYDSMRHTARWMLAWRWLSVIVIVTGFLMQITGQFLEANS